MASTPARPKRARAMQIDAARHVAAQTVMRVWKDQAFAAAVLQSELGQRARSPEGDAGASRDAALATQIAMGTLRHLGALDRTLAGLLSKPLKDLDAYTLAVMRTALFQLMHLDRVPDHAVLDRAVELVKVHRGPKLGALVNACLRRHVRQQPPASQASDHVSLHPEDVTQDANREASRAAHADVGRDEPARGPGAGTTHPTAETQQPIPAGQRAPGRASLQGSPAQGSPAQGSPAQGSPAQGSSAHGSPAQGSPAQGSPVRSSDPELPTWVMDGLKRSLSPDRLGSLLESMVLSPTTVLRLHGKRLPPQPSQAASMTVHASPRVPVTGAGEAETAPETETASEIETETAAQREAWIAHLRALFPHSKVARCRHAPRGIEVRGIGPAHRLQGVREGWMTVQEEGAQLCTLATEARPGEQVLDACAGRGNKALLLGEMVGLIEAHPSETSSGLSGDRAPASTAPGSITATDLHPKKLEVLRAAWTRMHFAPSGLRVSGVDWSRGRGDLPRDAFDCVLLDAPCSGLGTIRRRPEILTRLSAEDIPLLHARQLRMLLACAACTKPGGRLVYVVCSPLREEGIDVVEAFEARMAAGGECNAEGQGMHMQRVRSDRAWTQAPSAPSGTAPLVEAPSMTAQQETAPFKAASSRAESLKAVALERVESLAQASERPEAALPSADPDLGLRIGPWLNPSLDCYQVFTWIRQG